jgi:hypothetical protein
VLFTIAVAIWLRFLFLVPAVILLWMAPPSVRDAVAGDEPLTWNHAAALAAQLYLAGATRFTYKALRARLLVSPRTERLRQPAPAQPIPVEAPMTATAAVEAPAEAPAPETPFTSPKPALPCGRVLAPAEAATLIDRLLGLDRELRVSGESIRAMLEGSLGTSADQRESAASR